MGAFGVALIRSGFEQPVFLTDFRQTLGDQHPRAVIIGVNLAFPVFLPAAGAIRKPLGAAGHGADAAGLAQNAVTAHPAVFVENPHPLHLP